MPEAKNEALVESTEFIGRGLYGKSEKNIYTPLGSLDWQQFYDNRLNLDISVDRVGNHEVFLKSLKYLLPKAQARKDYFRGWAIIKVSVLQKENIEVYPDKVEDSDPLKENKLHAQIRRDNWREKEMARILAMTLSYMASQNKIVSPPEN